MTLTFGSDRSIRRLRDENLGHFDLIPSHISKQRHENLENRVWAERGEKKRDLEDQSAPGSGGSVGGDSRRRWTQRRSEGFGDFGRGRWFGRKVSCLFVFKDRKIWERERESKERNWVKTGAECGCLYIDICFRYKRNIGLLLQTTYTVQNCRVV